MRDFDLQGLAQVSISTDIPAHRRIVDGAISEITTLRQQLAEVTGCACSSEGPCKYHAMTSVSGRSYVLRKQADAVEEIVDADPDGRSEDGVALISVSEIWDYAQSLRQQADEAERAGGEHG